MKTNFHVIDKLNRNKMLAHSIILKTTSTANPFLCAADISLIHTSSQVDVR